MLSPLTTILDFHPDIPEPPPFKTYELTMLESEWILTCDILEGMGARRAAAYIQPCIDITKTKSKEDRGPENDPYLIITVPEDRVYPIRIALTIHLADRLDAVAQAEALIKEFQTND